MAIAQVKDRPLRSDNGFWTIFHAILGLGPAVELIEIDKDGHPIDKHTGQPIKGKEDQQPIDYRNARRINALDHICAGKSVRGMTFLPTRFGLDVKTAVGEEIFVGQGHQDQFVAEMAQWGMAKDRKFVVGKKEYKFEDFVKHSQMRANLKAE